jgi:hypothetical protein
MGLLAKRDDNRIRGIAPAFAEGRIRIGCRARGGDAMNAASGGGQRLRAKCLE